MDWVVTLSYWVEDDVGWMESEIEGECVCVVKESCCCGE